MKRFTIVNMMMLIAVIALGIAAMRSASPLSETAVFSVTLLALFVSLLGAIVTRGDAAWVGFALFGWGYAALAFLPTLRDEFQPHLPTNALLDAITDRLFAIPANPGTHPFVSDTRYPTAIASHKVENSVAVRLSQSELEIQKIYVDKATARFLRVQALGVQLKLAQRTGHAILALTFGLVGAVLGRFLARRHAARGHASGREFSPEAPPLAT